MSRTDVHRPWTVQSTDWHNRHRIVGFTGNTEELGVPRSWPWLMPLYNTCGCEVCAGSSWRRRSRRAVRHQWLPVERELPKATADDREDIDAAALRTSRQSYW